MNTLPQCCFAVQESLLGFLHSDNCWHCLPAIKQVCHAKGASSRCICSNLTQSLHAWVGACYSSLLNNLHAASISM